LPSKRRFEAPQMRLRAARLPATPLPHRMSATSRHATAPPRATYSISDLAREFALTTRAIRFYEDSGLIAPRREKRTRVYGERERVRRSASSARKAVSCAFSLRRTS
jgi:hypothetical protein